MPANQDTQANNAPVAASAAQEARRHATRVICVLALAGLLAWSYWQLLLELVNAWSTDPMYSHGYLVPLFALGLLWLRRAKMPTWSERVSWLGAILVVLGAVIHLLAGWLFVDLLAGAGLIISVAGLVALLGGWRLLRWAAPAVAFLAFMLPLPHSVAHALGHPLQRIATKASTYVLQTLGFPAVSEGNVILVNDLRIGVVEACSGLSMLVVFFALSTGMALVIRRPWWERVLLVLSAVPIALLANVGRIVLTTLAYDLIGGETADVIFHDLAGWLMMPFALFLMLVELQILRRLVIEEQRVVASPVPSGGSRASQRSERGRPRGRAR